MAPRPKLTFGKYKLIGKKRKDGVFYSWAGNIACPEDLDMALPNLRGIQIRKTTKIVALRQKLERIRAQFDELKIIADLGQVTVVRDCETESVYDLAIEGEATRLMVLNDVDGKDLGIKHPYSGTKRDQYVERRLDDVLGTRSHDGKGDHNGKDPLVRYVMARILQEADQPRGKDYNYRNLRTHAQEVLYRDRELKHVVVAEMELLPRDSEFALLLAEVEKHDTSTTPNPFRQFERDEYAAGDTSILELIDKSILIVLDRNRRLVVGHYSRLFQELFGEETFQAYNKTFDLWCTYQALPLPETSRHVLNKILLECHPDKSVELAADPYKARYCVAHYGCWNALGDPNGKRIFKTADSSLSRHTKSSLLFDLYDDLREGALSLNTKVGAWLFKTLAPEEYEESVEIFRGIPQKYRMDIAEEDYASLTALLVGAFTQDHVDKHDVDHGLTPLVQGGNYYNGCDFLFRQLGLRVRNPPGSCTIIRGRELYHSTTEYEGDRYTTVNTHHQAVKIHVYRLLGKSLPTAHETYDPCIVPPTEDEDDIEDRELHALLDPMLHGAPVPQGVLGKRKAEDMSGEELNALLL